MKCRGIEIEDGVYSGCDTEDYKLTDCPTCNGTGIETRRLIHELRMMSQGAGLDRDYKEAELLKEAADTIERFLERLNPTGQTRRDEQT